MNEFRTWIDSERLKGRFCRLVSIDSPSFGEREMADYVAGQLSELGIAVSEDDAAERIGGNAGNLFASLSGTVDLPPILLGAHLDTVKPACGKQAVCHEDGTITSAGDTVLGADDLATVAELLEVLTVLKECKIPHRPLELVFFAAEEPYTVGSRAFDFSKVQSKLAFIGDIEGAPGIAALQAPTILYYNVKIHGKASHAGFAPEAGIHAVKIAAEAIAELPLGRLDEETTAGLGILNGGLAPNIIPDLCIAEGELRGYNNEKVLHAFDVIRAEFEEKAAKYGGTVEFETEQRTTAYRVESVNEAALMFAAACRRAGLVPSFISTLGGSDASSTSKAGISSIVYSNGMHAIHSSKEYTSVEELMQTTEFLLELITLN